MPEGNFERDLGQLPDNEKLFYKAYDAATEASKRSRQMIYFALLIEFFCVFAIRETRFPRWTNARLGLMQDYSTCVKAPNTLEDCWSARRIYESAKLPLPSNNKKDQEYFTYTGDDAKVNVPHPMTEYEKFAAREQALISQSVADLAVPIPILGLRVDTNDLWIFVGPITAIFLLVLMFTLRADIAGTKLAKDAAQDNLDFKKMVDSIAVLGRGLTAGHKFDIAGFHVIRWLVVSMPVLNAFALAFFDFADKEGALVTSVALEKVTASAWQWPSLAEIWPAMDIVFEGMFLILVVVVAVFVFRASEVMILQAKQA